MSFLASCSSSDAPSMVRTYVDGPATKSPLSAYSGPGGFAADASPHTPWDFSDGQFFLCVTRAATEATITSVVPHPSAAAPPLSVTTWLRTTTRSAVKNTPAFKRRDFEGVNSKGTPPMWRDPQRTFVARGQWSTAIAGTRVAATCKQRATQQQAVLNGRVPNLSVAYELVITLKVGKQGGSVNGFDIHFNSDGQAGVLRVPWKITACGTARALRAQCDVPISHLPGNK
ncbi:hypothetical protein [Nocardioides montaniterrae]